MDLLGIVVQDDGASANQLHVIAVCFAVTLSAYLLGAMLRGSWHRHCGRVAGVAEDLVRREFHIHYAAMVARVAGDPGPGPVPCDVGSTMSFCSAVRAPSWRTRVNRVSPPPPPPDDIMLPSRTVSGAFLPPPPAAWLTTLRRGVDAYVDLELLPLITDDERRGILLTVGAELRARFWFLHRDHLELLAIHAYAKVYREYKEVLVRAYIRFVTVMSTTP